MRVLCNFSCGAASAVATKLAIAKYGHTHELLIVNAFIQEEHPDNRRFLLDCERWFGRPIHVVRDKRYDASTHEVWQRERYLAGQRGAPCSKILKRRVLDAVSKPGDLHILGYTADEADRLDRFIDAHNETRVEAPLIDNNLGKSDVLAMIQRAGIELPEMYRLGYHNANCIGCVKGGEGYWNKIRRDFPEQFERVAQIQERIGPGAFLFRHRSGPLKGVRYSLRELPPNKGRYQDEPSIECGSSCELGELLMVEDFVQEFGPDDDVDAHGRPIYERV